MTDYTGSASGRCLLGRPRHPQRFDPVKPMYIRLLGAVLVGSLAGACSPPESVPPAPDRPNPEAAATGSAASFVNRVWVVVESEQVELGSLRVFLSEGTLVMASPHATPALGTWREDDGRLVIVEEGLEYDVDIVELNENELRVRIHSPGEPVDIRFEPAERWDSSGQSS